MLTDLHCKSRYISSSSIWMRMSQSLGMIYERVKIIIRNPWPVSHTLTHSLPWASSFNFFISYEYLFIDSQLTNEEVKLFRYLYAHPYLYLVWQNFSHCWMNCLVVWLEHFNNSEIHFISQVISDVFGAPVFVSDIPNSAALGSCYRAKHGLYQRILCVLYQSICMSYKFLSWQIPNAFELIHLYNFWEKEKKSFIRVKNYLKYPRVDVP